MDNQVLDLLQRAIRVLMLGAIPALAIPAVGLAVALLQGMMAIREESATYAVRAIAAVGVILLFGASVGAALIELATFAFS